MTQEYGVRKDLQQTPYAAVAQAVARTGVPENARNIYSGRNTLWITSEPAAVIKSYAVPVWIKGMIYRLRMPKAQRAFMNAQQLLSMGIPTPEPYFFTLRRGFCGNLKQSHYACAPAMDYVELRGVQNREDFEEIAAALGAFIADIHRKGVWMKDMSPGNILWKQDEAGSYRFTLVDINRMEFGVHNPEVLIRNFDALLDTEDATAAVACAYASEMGLGTDFVNTVRKRYRDYYNAAIRRRRFKKLFKKK